MFVLFVLFCFVLFCLSQDECSKCIWKMMYVNSVFFEELEPKVPMKVLAKTIMKHTGVTEHD